MRWLLVLALSLPRVAIGVHPRVVQQDAQIYISCHVARHPDNRTLIMGITNWAYSTRQLDGEHALVFFYMVTPAPRDVSTVMAFCLVVDADEHTYLVRREVVISSPHPAG